MPIKSSTFGGVTLSGKSAEAFYKQFVMNKTPNKLALEALKRGREMMKEFDEKGYVTIKKKTK
jgi:hypothetical protein